MVYVALGITYVGAQKVSVLVLREYTTSSPCIHFPFISLPKPRSDILKKSISYQAAALWNSLDNSTRAADSLPSFKKLIRSLKWHF